LTPVVVSSVTPLILEHVADAVEQRDFLLARGLGYHRAVALGARAEMQQQRGIAAIVEDHVGMRIVRPLEDAVGEFPVLRQALALVGEYAGARGRDCCGGMILGREDVAGSPAHLCAERLQRLDQHRGLDRHVQRAGDARAAQWLGRREFLADRHQSRHLGLGDRNLLATPVGQRQVGDPEILPGRVSGRVGLGRCVRLNRTCSSSHGSSTL
jgi:hypothetical protein